MKFRYHKFNLSPSSDFCIFDAGLGEYLDLKIKSGTEVGFSYDISKNGYGILGQKGFFDKSIGNSCRDI